NWILVLFASICIGLLLANLKPERGYILTNDNYSPEINTSLSIDRSLLSPAWRFYRGIGIASDSEQADLFRTLVYHALNPVLGGELTNQALIVGSILVASVGIFLLTLSIVDLVGAKVNRLQTSLIAS